MLWHLRIPWQQGRVVAPANCVTFLTLIFFAFNAETQQGWSSGLWDHHSTLRLSTIQPDQLDHPREEESRNKSHASPAWFKAAPGWCLVAVNWKWTKWDSSWPNDMKSETVVPTETCLHHNVLDQAVQLTECRTTAGQGKLDSAFITFVHIWISITVSTFCNLRRGLQTFVMQPCVFFYP